MANTRVIDELVTVFGFRTNTAALRGLESRVQSLQRRLNTASRGFTVAGGIITGALFGVGKEVLETDRAMKTLESRTGANAEQMARFKKQAYDVGQQLPLNTADIIRAQTAFVQLGNSIESAIKATPAIAMAAVAAEGLDVEAAARYASFALNGFSLESEHATGILDAMLKTETITAANTISIGEAFRFSAKAASDAGLDYQTYIAVLGVLAGSGRSAEESSQGLNVLMQKLAKGMTGIGRGGKMVDTVFKALGIQSKEVQDLMAQGPEGFIKFIERLASARDEFGQDSLTAALGSLVGESYASAFSHLVDQVEQLRFVQDELYVSGGEGARQSAIRMKGYSGAWESMLASYDTAINKLGDAGISGALEKVFRKVAGLLDKFAELDARTMGWVASLLLTGPALLAIGGALKVASIALGGLIPMLRAVRWLTATMSIAPTAIGLAWITMAAKVKAVMFGTFTAIKVRAMAMWLTISTPKLFLANIRLLAVRMTAIMGKAFATIGAAARVALFTTGLIGLTLLGLAALATLVFVAWKPISTFFSGFWEGMKIGAAKVSEAWDEFMGSLGPFGEDLKKVFEDVRNGWNDLVEALGYDLSGTGESWGEALATPLIWVIELLTTAAEKVKWLTDAYGKLVGIRGLWASDQENNELQAGTVDPLAKATGGVLSWPIPESSQWAFGRDAPEVSVQDSGQEQPDTRRPFFGPDPPGAPALAAATPVAGGATTINNSSRSTAITVERIDVNAEGGDPIVISDRIGAALDDRLRTTAEDYDSGVDR